MKMLLAQAYAALPEPPPEPLFQFHLSPLAWLALWAGACCCFVLGWWLCRCLAIEQLRMLLDDIDPLPVLPPDAPAIPIQPRQRRVVSARHSASEF